MTVLPEIAAFVPLKEITPTLFYGVAVINAAIWALLAVLLIAGITKPGFWTGLKKWLGKHADKVSFGLVLGAMLGSLWLSDIARITPCPLCWWQRIFMYPLVVVLGIALVKNCKKFTYSVRTIALWLSGIGALIAGYHYALQRIDFLAQAVPCQATASCSTMYLGYWGFYSIPLMALTTFVAIFVIQRFFARKA